MFIPFPSHFHRSEKGYGMEYPIWSRCRCCGCAALRAARCAALLSCRCDADPDADRRHVRARAVGARFHQATPHRALETLAHNLAPLHHHSAHTRLVPQQVSLPIYALA